MKNIARAVVALTVSLLMTACNELSALSYVSMWDNIDVEPQGSSTALEVEVVAHQWFWTYSYADAPGSKYASRLDQASQEARQLGTEAAISEVSNYLLDVDKPLVIPVHTEVVLKITSADVIHAWWVPELAVKKDAVPGFINVVWFEAKKKGIYRGVCAELCGRDHGYMPIVVHVVDYPEFEAWVKARQAENAAAPE